MRVFELITDSWLDESLNRKVDYHQDVEYLNKFNSELGHKILPSHTNAMRSDKMAQNQIRVVRFKDKNKYIQYHIVHDYLHPGDETKMDLESGQDAIKWIMDDAVFYLSKGTPIKILCPTDIKVESYKKLASHLLKRNGIQQPIKVIGKELGVDNEEHPVIQIGQGPQSKLPTLEQLN